MGRPLPPTFGQCPKENVFFLIDVFPYWCYFLDQEKAEEEGWGKRPEDGRSWKQGLRATYPTGSRWDYCSMNDHWDYEGNVSSQYL